MNDLKIRTRKLREFVGYNQTDLAHELNMTQSAYCKLETGKTRFDLHRTQQLANFYGFTINDLLERDLTELYNQLLANSNFKDTWGGVKVTI